MRWKGNADKWTCLGKLAITLMWKWIQVLFVPFLTRAEAWRCQILPQNILYYSYNKVSDLISDTGRCFSINFDVWVNGKYIISMFYVSFNSWSGNMLLIIFSRSLIASSDLSLMRSWIGTLLPSRSFRHSSDGYLIYRQIIFVDIHTNKCAT